MVQAIRDGKAWRVGTNAEVEWINAGTTIDMTITSAIPPVFASYATVVLPPGGVGRDQHDEAVLSLLTRHTTEQPWWLGYLDTGGDDIVFPDVPKVTAYAGWSYVLVEAGPEQAASWRAIEFGSFWQGARPNLIFPADRSWLVSTLWDDDWTCIGGPVALIADFLQHPGLEARPVVPGENATPPGHQAF